MYSDTVGFYAQRNSLSAARLQTHIELIVRHVLKGHIINIFIFAMDEVTVVVKGFAHSDECTEN